MAYNRVDYDNSKKGNSTNSNSNSSINGTPVFGDGGKNYLDPTFSNTWNYNKTSSTNKPWGSSSSGSWVGSGNKGSGGGSGGGGSSNSTDEAYGQYAYPDLSAIYQARLESQLNALKTQRDNAVKGYQSQISALRPQYQDLRNQSEVERYKAEGKLRNALADRGALDSGAGRTETLNMQTNYGNALNKINAQEQSAVDSLQRAIADVNAQYAQQEADARANMYDDLSNWLIGITPMAVNTQANYDTAKNSIVDGNLANVGSNVGANMGSSDLTSVPGIGFLLGGNTGLANVDPNNTEAYKLLRNALSKRLLGNALGY